MLGAKSAIHYLYVSNAKITGQHGYGMCVCLCMCVFWVTPTSTIFIVIGLPIISRHRMPIINVGNNFKFRLLFVFIQIDALDSELNVLMQMSTKTHDQRNNKIQC